MGPVSERCGTSRPYTWLRGPGMYRHLGSPPLRSKSVSHSSSEGLNIIVELHHVVFVGSAWSWVIYSCCFSCLHWVKWLGVVWKVHQCCQTHWESTPTSVTLSSIFLLGMKSYPVNKWTLPNLKDTHLANRRVCWRVAMGFLAPSGQKCLLQD